MTTWCGSFVKALGLVIGLAFGLAASGAETYRWSDVERVVVVPDVHGAYSALVELLKTTGMIDAAGKWTGGKTHLVSLGDLLDRGPESRRVMDLLMRLQAEAGQVGGRVHVVAGNHELMNLIGDLRYVSAEEFAAFSTEETEAMRAAAPDANRVYPPGYFAYRKAFKADGKYGRWLLTLPAIIVINDTAYAHGGLPPVASTTSLSELNRQYRETVTDYLALWSELVAGGILPDDKQGDAGTLAQSALANAEQSTCLTDRVEACMSAQQTSKLEAFVALSQSPLLSDQGPLWFRGAAYCRPMFERPVLDAALANLDATRVVVGHTTAPDAKVHALHDNRMVLMDTGMLVAYYKGRPAALVSNGSEEYVQYLNPAQKARFVQDDYPYSYELSARELREAAKSGTVSVIDKNSDGPHWTVSVSYEGKSINALFLPDDKKGAANRELAAYRLSEMMGADLVPVTTDRIVNDTPGVLQLVYENSLTEARRLNDKRRMGGWCSMNRQFDLLRVWDLLIANSGRTTENVWYQLPLWRVHVNTHSDAFGTDRLSKNLKKQQIQLHPELRDALNKLTRDSLQDNLGELIGKKNVDALLKRRDKLLRLL